MIHKFADPLKTKTLTEWISNKSNRWKDYIYNSMEEVVAENFADFL